MREAARQRAGPPTSSTVAPTESAAAPRVASEGPGPGHSLAPVAVSNRWSPVNRGRSTM